MKVLIWTLVRNLNSQLIKIKIKLSDFHFCFIKNSKHLMILAVDREQFSERNPHWCLFRVAR